MGEENQQEQNGQKQGQGAVSYEQFKVVNEERERFKGELETLTSTHQATTEELARAQAERDAAQQNATRLRIAVGKGLPIDLADRLTGKDEAELTADAERLLAFVRPITPGVPPPTVGDGRLVPLDTEHMSAKEVREKEKEILAGVK